MTLDRVIDLASQAESDEAERAESRNVYNRNSRIMQPAGETTYWKPKKTNQKNQLGGKGQITRVNEWNRRYNDS